MKVSVTKSLFYYYAWFYFFFVYIYFLFISPSPPNLSQHDMFSLVSMFRRGFVGTFASGLHRTLYVTDCFSSRLTERLDSLRKFP